MAKGKEKQKNPFVGLTLEEVFAAERDTYFIQIDTDVFAYKNKIAFSGRIINGLYDKVIDDLTYLLKKGSPEEAEDAHRCLLNVYVWPLRIH